MRYTAKGTDGFSLIYNASWSIVQVITKRLCPEISVTSKKRMSRSAKPSGINRGWRAWRPAPFRTYVRARGFDDQLSFGEKHS